MGKLSIDNNENQNNTGEFISNSLSNKKAIIFNP